MTLNEIGLKYSTDKASNGHDYLKNYEKLLGNVREQEFTLLEIGVASGASIRAWREYFPKARVYGVDINPDCAGEGIFIGSQTDREFMIDILSKIGSPHVVIDDCSHEGWRTIETFEHLFPKIAPEGLYFVEDTATFYNNYYSGEFESNNRSRVFNFFTGLAYDVDVAGRGCTGNTQIAINWHESIPPVPKYSRILESIHIYPSLWMFKRK